MQIANNRADRVPRMFAGQGPVACRLSGPSGDGEATPLGTIGAWTTRSWRPADRRWLPTLTRRVGLGPQELLARGSLDHRARRARRRWGDRRVDVRARRQPRSGAAPVSHASPPTQRPPTARLTLSRCRTEPCGAARRPDGQRQTRALRRYARDADSRSRAPSARTLRSRQSMTARCAESTRRRRSPLAVTKRSSITDAGGATSPKQSCHARGNEQRHLDNRAGDMDHTATGDDASGGEQDCQPDDGRPYGRNGVPPLSDGR
jgi:hypothetical protein